MPPSVKDVLNLKSLRRVNRSIARIEGKKQIGVLLVFLAALAASLCAADTAGSRHEASARAWFNSTGDGNPGLAEQVPSPGQEEHAVSPKADEIARVLGIPITNSMLVSWIVAIGLIILARFATRNMESVPHGAQNFLEWLVEGLYKFLEGILGTHLARRTFWFLATIFIFILAANWIGLVPGIGSLGWGHQTPHGFKIDQPLFRGANADVNMTLAMALVFFACWIVWALREIGPLGFLKEMFAPKGESSGLLRLLMIVIFFAVGCLEVVSILFRPVSLSFRLYGNMMAGESMLDAMVRLSPHFGWLLQIPFYFLELLVGLVQAMVFTLLTAVFTLLICQHEEGPLPAHT